jgi:hypothetical protein
MGQSNWTSQEEREVRRTEVQAAVATIASTVSFPIVEIPPELQDMETVDAIHHRLRIRVEAMGGYEVLAGACPAYSASIWRSKIDRNGRYKLNVDDFQKLIQLLDDQVLVALLGKDFKDYYLVDLRALRAIPASEYSLADLSWALKRYSGMGTMLACDWREAMLDGVDSAPIKADMLQLLQETRIVLHQISLAVEARRALAD